MSGCSDLNRRRRTPDALCYQTTPHPDIAFYFNMVGPVGIEPTSRAFQAPANPSQLRPQNMVECLGIEPSQPKGRRFTVSPVSITV